MLARKVQPSASANGSPHVFWLRGNRKLNSYKIFMDFVEYSNDKSKVISTDKVFSRECYQKWVSSRKIPCKDIESSFRRALIGHVTGNDRRRPFPPEVEKSLLAILRKKQVWDCFRGHTRPVGARGFRKLGYHEKLQQCGTDHMVEIPDYNTSESDDDDMRDIDDEEMSDSDDDQINSTPLQLPPPPPTRSFEENLKQGFPTPPFLGDSRNISFNILPSEVNARLLSVDYHSNIFNESQNGSSAFATTHKFIVSADGFQLPYSHALTVVKTSVPCCESCAEYEIMYKIYHLVTMSTQPWTPAGKFANELVYNLHPSLAFAFLRQYEFSKTRDPSIDMLGPLFYEKLNMNPDNDPRLKRSFAIAPAGWDMRKPIGTLVTDIANGHIVKKAWLDEEILGESLLTRVWTDFQAPIQLAVRWVHAFPVAMTTGESWSHVELKLSTGKRKILLANSKFLPNDKGHALVKFQDVSEHFEHVLKLGELR